MNKINVPIKGMHCRSCEILIEESISKISHVKKIDVDCKRHSAEVFYDSKKPNMGEIERAVREAGYEIGEENAKTFLTTSKEEYKDLGIAALFLLGVYLLLRNLGITELNIVPSSNSYSLPVVLLVGITAGLSTCMALVGGLILGISARHSELHPEATPMQKFRPHLFFNAGRIAGYALLGGLLGVAGSVLQLSGTFLGFLTIVVGLIMLALGLKLTGIFPWLENFNLTLPKSVGRFFGIKQHEREYSHKGSFMAGALTFFLPCGFTQAMQLFAVSTGSFAQGFLIMGVFALGTAPGLLGIGGVTSAVKGIFAKRFFKFAGIVVVLMSLFNISNGYNLTGWQLSGIGSQEAGIKNDARAQVSDPNVKMVDGVQVVSMTENSRGYSPNKFTIKKGIPVRWEIDAKDPYSCASSLMISKLGIRKNLKAGKNVIEFTPKETGKLAFSCSMGMYTGVFNVVDGSEDVSVSAGNENVSVSGSAGGCGGSAVSGSAGGGCGGGSAAQKNLEEEIATEAKIVGGKQVITTDYTAETDIAPSAFVVKAGTPVRFEVNPKSDGYGCMSTIMIPGLYNRQELLREGEKIVMEFTPKEKGDYNITCGMGMVRGTLTVN
ncbi:MAG: Heavy metal transport/detoxification protein [Candidatus Moranbacteria bacterium GW2011_GWE2_47_10]|nr:MAG: Heavy metal transport/detoxification protein [Candidatus Moranbacteria bacterium GW2011_GWE2_47_10]